MTQSDDHDANISLSHNKKTGVLFVNLGTPSHLSEDAVGQYLSEFLNDPLVIRAPRLIRMLLVDRLIVPLRKSKSLKKYQKIWRTEGSPLLVESQKVTRAFDEFVKKDKPEQRFVVTLGMRYGSPSLMSAVELLISKNVEKILVIPLYPQEADSTTGTVRIELARLQQAQSFHAGETLQSLFPPIKILPVFYKHPDFIQAQADQIKKELKDFSADGLILSYHGLPVSHIKKQNPNCGPCLSQEKCNELKSINIATCYRGQCYTTSSLVFERLKSEGSGLLPEHHGVSFQSRLGPMKWIGPATTALAKEWAEQKGVRRLLVACPAFVTDGLETLEEIGMELNDEFQKWGGKEVRLVPSLNAEPKWVETLAKWVYEYAQIPS